jgi:uroporphyrin-III C-methyltransferase
VYLVGAGPGDPDLLTRKALMVMEKANLVIYDRPVPPKILALANPAATFLNAGKHRGQHEEIQGEIYAWFLRAGRHASTIVRLKCGDPMVFGRGGALTYRGIAASFAAIAGHRESISALDWFVEHRNVIGASLLDNGRPPEQPVAFLERATTDRERFVEATLEKMAVGEVQVEAPAVIVIGEVVRLRRKLYPKWCDKELAA